MSEICAAAAARGSRIWIDAEQQVFQSTIDNWAIDLMRRSNRQGKVIVFNTIQAYLKSSAKNVTRHLDLAQAEGWALGIKLVRGAYIAHDHRPRIHETKGDTDENYDQITQSLLTQQCPTGQLTGQLFPDVRLFVASHNAESIRKAYSLSRHRTQNGLPTIPAELVQLQGMADEISCELLAYNSIHPGGAQEQAETELPGVFKCLAWGSLEECLHFLLRRAIENHSAMGRTRLTAKAMRKEAWRRLRWSIR